VEHTESSAALRYLLALRPNPSRWWYLPFALASGVVGFLALGEGLNDALPYAVLLLILMAQILRPTFAGWSAALITWAVLCFVWPLYSRLVDHLSNFNVVFLICWGFLPLVALWLLRPRRTGLT
jgi:hypothetical protein